MTFANVNIGTSAGDHTGDPLRTAFDKINKNFANIAAGNITVNVNAPVMRVNGKTGNVWLNAQDIAGVVTAGRLSTVVNAANITARNYTDQSINNLVNGAPLALNTLQELAAALANDQTALGSLAVSIDTAVENQLAANIIIYDHIDRIDALEGNAHLQQISINTLTSNAASQAISINGINTEINSLWANAASQVDQIELVALDTTALTANARLQAIWLGNLQSNANVQAIQIDSLRANVEAANAVIATHTVQISSLFSNAASQGNELASLTANAASQASELTSLTANAASQASVLTTLTANAASQSNDLTTLLANAATQGQSLQTLFSNAVSQAESLTTLLGNATTQAESINAINANVTAANLAISAVTTAWTANAAVQALAIDSINSNVAAANLAIAAVTTAWTANAAVQANAISDLSSSLTANAATQATAINSINANVTAANANIATINSTISSINTTVAGLVSNVTTGPIGITGNITAGNVILTTNGAVRFPDGSVQTTAAITADTGNIVLTENTIGTVNGSGGITINASGDGEVVISDNLGINNINPAYSIDIGNINENENTGAVGINFNNDVASVGHRYGSALIGWDWWDQNGHGTNNDGTEHYRFGIYNGNTAPFTHAWLSFDKDAPANSITVDNTGSVTVNKMVLDTLTSNVQIRRTEIETNAPSSVEPIDLLSATQWLHTANTTQNFVFNVRGNSTVSLNTVLDIGRQVTIQYGVVNGNVGYALTGVQVDGVAQTVRYLGGTAPTGTPNGTDLYNINITKLANATFNVLVGQQRYS